MATTNIRLFPLADLLRFLYLVMRHQPLATGTQRFPKGHTLGIAHQGHQTSRSREPLAKTQDTISRGHLRRVRHFSLGLCSAYVSSAQPRPDNHAPDACQVPRICARYESAFTRLHVVLVSLGIFRICVVPAVHRNPALGSAFTPKRSKCATNVWCGFHGHFASMLDP